MWTEGTILVAARMFIGEKSMEINFVNCQERECVVYIFNGMKMCAARRSGKKIGTKENLILSLRKRNIFHYRRNLSNHTSSHKKYGKDVQFIL